MLRSKLQRTYNRGLPLAYFPARGTGCTCFCADLIHFILSIYNRNLPDAVYNFRHSTIVCFLYTEIGEEPSPSSLEEVVAGAQENQYSSLPVIGARQGSCTAL